VIYSNLFGAQNKDYFEYRASQRKSQRMYADFFNKVMKSLK